MAVKKKASPTMRRRSTKTGPTARTGRDPAIDEYLDGTSPEARALLQALRKTIHKVVPGVEECISYRIPAFRYDGRIIAGFSATWNIVYYDTLLGRLDEKSGRLTGVQKGVNDVTGRGVKDVNGCSNRPTGGTADTRRRRGASCRSLYCYDAAV